MKADVKSSLSLNPDSASPVLKTKITVQLETDFPYTLAKEDLSINATSIDDNTYIRYMNVLSVDDDAKTFVAMFGGAYSGKFQISIRHSAYGLVGTDNLILDVGAYVTEYSPMTGSIYGGTLLTITGNNFGNVYTDNPVQISNNGGIGSIDCFVQETSDTEIKCRIESGLEKAGGVEDDMVVFLKTSEEATCEPKSKCVFTWEHYVPELTGVSLDFDQAALEWVFTATGTLFSGDTSTTDLQIGTVSQTPISVSNTEAKFTIDNVTSRTLNSNVLYFDVGLPGGHSLVEATFAMTPKLVSVSPVSGSVGGTLITATVPGATVSDSVDILDSTGTSICETSTVTTFGVVECRTLAQEIASTELSVSHLGAISACVSIDASVCTYEQLAASAFPAVESTSLTQTTIVFTGTNLDIADCTATASFFDVDATSVVVDSATQATATFDLGVPVVTGDVFPELLFTKDAIVYFAPSAAALVSDLSVTASLSGLQCSFAGDCTYEVTANGLASIVR